jgi:hypothetical protein
MKGFGLVAQFTFQPSRTYAQYDLAALVSDIDETTTDTLASEIYSCIRGALATCLADRRYWPICSFNDLPVVSVKPWFDGQAEERSGLANARPKWCSG